MSPKSAAKIKITPQLFIVLLLTLLALLLPIFLVVWVLATELRTKPEPTGPLPVEGLRASLEAAANAALMAPDAALDAAMPRIGHSATDPAAAARQVAAELEKQGVVVISDQADSNTARMLVHGDAVPIGLVLSEHGFPAPLPANSSGSIFLEVVIDSHNTSTHPQ